MNRNRVLAFGLALASIAAMTACSAAADSAHTPAPMISSAPHSLSLNKIQHVIIIVQENRSTDNMFQGLPGADVATSGLGADGKPITLQAIPLTSHYDLDHEHGNFTADYDGGKMDGFQSEVAQIGKGGHVPPNPAYGYVPESDVAPYFQMAEQYVFADRMFQTNQGPSFPAHQYLIGGTAAPSAGSPLLASGNPGDAKHLPPLGGCDSPPDMLVTMIDQTGNQNYHLYPCFDHQTLIDLLDAGGISWAYYEPQIGGFWDGPDAISHIRSNPADWARVIVPETTILNNISNGTLPQVSWVIPNGSNSDHPGSGNGGPSWVASIVNSVGASQYWDSSAIFITWDDWGGWYDHVAPQIDGSNELGFRVPLILVSPYAKTGYVSHKQHEFGSILRFVEENWLLGSTGFTDARSDDFDDCFDFTQTARTFQQVQAPYSRSHFLSSTRKFSAPDSD